MHRSLCASLFVVVLQDMHELLEVQTAKITLDIDFVVTIGKIRLLYTRVYGLYCESIALWVGWYRALSARCCSARSGVARCGVARCGKTSLRSASSATYLGCVLRY